MKTRALSVSLILSMFYLSGLSCSKTDNWDQAAQELLRKITLNELYTYKLHSGVQPLPDLGRMAPSFQADNAAETFAFYDQTQKQFVFTDSLGGVKTIFGGGGYGPEEFIKVASYIFSDEGRLYVYDHEQYMIKVFEADGSFAFSFVLEPEDVYIDGLSLMVHDDLVYIGIVEIKHGFNPYSAGSSAQIGVFNEKGKQIRFFGEYDSYTNKSNAYELSPLQSRSLDGKRGYTVQKNSFLVQGWDFESQEKVYITHTVPPHYNLGKERIDMNLPVSEIIKRSGESSLSENLFETDEFLFLNYITLTDVWFQTTDHSEKEHYLAVFNKSGNLIGDIRLPYQLANIVNGRLHLVLDDNPDNYEIGVYELLIE